MSGHSKWSTIKRKKEATDSKRAKIFTKIGRELTVAVKEGGADPLSNSKLKDTIAKAKQNNVPNDNIDRIIKKASGGNDKNDYEEIVYEGYGPNGIAVIVEALTDNRNRTAGDLRHYFDKYGGNLGQSGSVSFLFERKGVIYIENPTFTEDELTEDALIDGVEDISYSAEMVEIKTESTALIAVTQELTGKGYNISVSELQYIPSTYVEVTDEDVSAKFTKLIDLLEDNDDIQEIWHNAV